MPPLIIKNALIADGGRSLRGDAPPEETSNGRLAERRAGFKA
ncbi:MAG: hypothetical protein SOR75_09630 [Synergistes jonesii]|nr:hypothetical protein [Synergistes jonesii]MDY2985577.1 hypothetical protein [Synergistes jonesii]